MLERSSTESGDLRCVKLLRAISKQFCFLASSMTCAYRETKPVWRFRMSSKPLVYTQTGLLISAPICSGSILTATEMAMLLDALLCWPNILKLLDETFCNVGY